MANFKYVAKNGPKRVEGIIEAQSKEDAIDRISQSGILPITVEETSAETKLKSKKLALFSGNIKSRDITIFTRQLSSLIKSGVPILRALNIISKQTDNHKLKEMLDNIQASVRDGKAFSSTLTDYPKVFSPLYIAMVRSGESSGTLQGVLLRIAEYRQKEEQLMSSVRTALAYPVLMAIVGAGTIFFMFTFVMPRLMRVFTRMGQDLPLPTKILLAISYVFQKFWILIILILGIIIFLIIQGSKRKAQRLFISKLKLRLPLLGEFFLKSELARFCRTLEVLIHSGIPILNAIKITVPILSNEVIRADISRSDKDVEQGSSFGGSLESSKFIPEFMSSLIIVGEESGNLDESLGEIASSYERDTDETIKLLTSLLEPTMILVMGLIVGFIVIAMLLPIFQMNVAVQ